MVHISNYINSACNDDIDCNSFLLVMLINKFNGLLGASVYDCSLIIIITIIIIFIITWVLLLLLLLLLELLFLLLLFYFYHTIL